MKGVIFTDGQHYTKPSTDEFQAFLLLNGWVGSLIFSTQFSDKEIVVNTPNTAYPVRYLVGPEQLSLSDPSSSGEVIDVRSKTMVRKALRNGGVAVNSVCEYPVDENGQTAFFNDIVVVLLSGETSSELKEINFSQIRGRKFKFYEILDNQLREF